MLEIMRVMALSALMIMACFAAGCSTTSQDISVSEDAEPQRIVFGDTRIVQANFAERMRVCWFAVGGALPEGYSFQVLDKVESGQPQAIHVFNDNDRRTPAFEIQFFSRHDNTLIATRNHSMPKPLADALELSIETWLMDSGQCRGPGMMAGARPFDSAQIQTTSYTPPASEAKPFVLPPLDPPAEPQAETEVDMHRAELLARGELVE
jgi:hypothetical protein